MTLATMAGAQEYPIRLIRFIVPFPPAGATDVYARIVAKELQASWGQSVIVENRTGATGLIGTELAKRAPSPDGSSVNFYIFFCYIHVLFRPYFFFGQSSSSSMMTITRVRLGPA